MSYAFINFAHRHRETLDRSIIALGSMAFGSEVTIFIQKYILHLFH
jgi:hypothetical protein